MNHAASTRHVPCIIVTVYESVPVPEPELDDFTIRSAVAITCSERDLLMNMSHTTPTCCPASEQHEERFMISDWALSESVPFMSS